MSAKSSSVREWVDPYMEMISGQQDLPVVMGKRDMMLSFLLVLEEGGYTDTHTLNVSFTQNKAT